MAQGILKRALVPEGARPFSANVTTSKVVSIEHDTLSDGADSLPADGIDRALTPVLEARMADAALGADFSAPRIREGPRASPVGAKSNPQGTNIHFAPRRYQPNSRDGQALLGHELTHVVQQQQQQGRVAATTHAKSIAIDDDSGLER